MNSSDLTDRVRSALPLSAVISERVKLRKRGKEFLGLCPFHGEKTPSFTINDEKSLYYCFGCGAKGDHFDFLMKTQGMNFPEAMAYLAEKAGIALPKKGDGVSQPTKPWHRWMQRAADWYAAQLQMPLFSPVLSYCLERGVSLVTLKAFGLGFAPENSDDLWQTLQMEGAERQDLVTLGLLGVDEERGRSYGRFRNRLMVPIHDRRGRVVGFGGRLLKGEGPKYLNSPETPLFHKGELLYAQHFAADQARKMQELFIVEGYFDVISLFERGIERAVAPLGTGFTPSQMQIAWQLCAEPTICFDGDEAGMRAARRVLDVVFPYLKPGFSLSFLFLPNGEDPDSFVKKQGAEAFLALRENRLSLSSFLWQTEWRQSPLETPEQRAHFKTRVRERVRQIQDRDVRDAYGQEMANRFAQEQRHVGQVYARKKGRAYGPSSPQYVAGNTKKPRLFSDALLLQQKIVLTVVLNHPSLLIQDIEVFAAINFSQGALEELQKEIISYINLRLPLDSGALKTHLGSKGMKSHLDQLQDVSIHARFALPSIPEAQVRQGWQELLFQVIRKTHLKQDILSAKGLLMESMNQEQWRRFKALVIHQDESEASQMRFDGD